MTEDREHCTAVPGIDDAEQASPEDERVSSQSVEAFHDPIKLPVRLLRWVERNGLQLDHGKMTRPDSSLENAWWEKATGVKKRPGSELDC